MRTHADSAMSENTVVDGLPRRRPADSSPVATGLALRPSPAATVLALQRTAGNRATTGLFSSLVAQRVLGAYRPSQHHSEPVTANETATYERLDDRGRPSPQGQNDRWTETENGKKVKHYLIAWLDDDTVVLGLKAAQSPYGRGGYGLGYPALAGGTSEMSGPEMDVFYGGGNVPSVPADGMRDRTLREEVGQELWDDQNGQRNPYQLDQTVPIEAVGRPGSDARNIYKTWEGKVSRDPNDLQAKPPRPQIGHNGPTLAQGKQLAYYENTGTFQVKVSVLASRVGAHPTKEEILREVAQIAGNSVPADITGDEQARIYLDAGNYPLQEFAGLMIEKIEAHRRAALTAPQPEAARDGKRKAEEEEQPSNKRRETEENVPPALEPDTT